MRAVRRAGRLFASAAVGAAVGALPSSHTSVVSNARTSVRRTLRPRLSREASFTSSSFSLRSPSATWRPGHGRGGVREHPAA
ncbi:hypothetical protein MXAN_5452 [Myxococcus xanthus DK 1622]|uniref:Uncharacterized protein n=1 Tax=Myxococcus xanthus (strain DK1622) TaxID=246197 RepID=Q1D178_MYXXD|nr:hypothetical protein MXAN_5452 [Myxococcus xanthus DK 1622]